MDSNLYDFLRMIENSEAIKMHLTRARIDWLTTYLRNPGTILELRSRPTGRMIPMAGNQVLVQDGVMLADREEPELEKHFAIAGSPQDVFAMLHEAMMLNPLLAQLIISASRAYMSTAPMCRACSQRHNGKPIEDCPDLEHPSWEFKERVK